MDEIIRQVITLILLTLTPFLELRASIPYGVFRTQLSLTVIFLITAVTNIILAPVIYLFLDKVVHIFLKIRVIEKLYHRSVERAQRKIHKYVERYGLIGLALFIAIPLPGSGVYSGALGAYVLGFKFKEFFRAAIIGVLLAGVAVLLISTIGYGIFGFLLR